MDDNTTHETEEEDVALVEEEKRQDRITRWFVFLSPAAEVLSWLLLIFYLGISIYNLYTLFGTLRGGAVPTATAILTGPLFTLLIGMFYFLVLQSISKGIDFLLDIRENIAYLVERCEE